MSKGFIMPCRTLIALLLAAMTAGCGPSPPPPSPELLARCQRDFALWVRYHHNQTVIHTGQRAKAELALYRCQQGHYHPWIEDIEDMLRRGKVPLPPS